jgi:murein DD-endopeptidase MepM/ murein hydrolase activator NlpD
MTRSGAAFRLFLLLVALPLAGEESCVLAKGDTLYGLSRRFDVPVAILQAYNGIQNPAALRVGATIRIPASYKVRKGDTLYSIARDHGVGLAELTRLNAIARADALVVGRRLFLPAGARSAKPATPPSAAPGAPASTPTSVSGSTPASVPGSAPTSVSGSTPASVPGSAQLWPHPGKREALAGRMTGAVIYGEAGDRILSVSAGRVVWVGPYRGFSRVVLIESENGYTYVYGGNEETLVAVGDRVRQGTQIGLLGRNAHQGIPQLYFLVYRDGVPVDPSQAPRS